MGRVLAVALPILVVAALLQVTFVPQVRAFGGGPNFVLLWVLAWSAESALDDAIVWAFTGGLLLDLVGGTPLGASTLGLLVGVFVIIGVASNIYRLGAVLFLGLVLLATLIDTGVVTVVQALIGVPANPAHVVSVVLLPTMAFHAVLALPTRWAARWLRRRLYGRRMTMMDR